MTITPDLEIRTWKAKHPKAFRRILEISIIFFAFLAGATMLWPEKTSGEAQSGTLTVNTAVGVNSDQPEPLTGAFVLKDSYVMSVTGFSTFECKTSYCRSQVGKPRQYVVALNKKFGKAKSVFIPVFDRFYDVIGTTDQNTDLDIFFGDDYQSAKELGRKQLVVNIVK